MQFDLVDSSLCDHDRDICHDCKTTCRICDGRFSSLQALDDHVALMHELNEEDCKYCGRPFGH